MPSSTPNFNWPYPISSDDLNAGATEIGNLANAADTTMATRAPLNSPTLTGTPASTTPGTSDNSTRIATTAYVKNNLANYATSPLAAIDATRLTITTNGAGFATMPAAAHRQVVTCSSAGPFIAIHATVASTTEMIFSGLTFSTYTIAASIAIPINYITWDY